MQNLYKILRVSNRRFHYKSLFFQSTYDIPQTFCSHKKGYGDLICKLHFAV